MTDPTAEPVSLRAVTADDEVEVMRAQEELAADDFTFVFREPTETWADYLARSAREERGVDLPPDRVRATFALAVRGEEIVGRVSVRHELTDWLLAYGGHIGYAVRPAYRRRGYASSILRQALELTDASGIERVLVTCDDGNVGSARTIEGAGGVLENVLPDGDQAPKRRYWIDRSTQVAALRG